MVIDDKLAVPPKLWGSCRLTIAFCVFLLGAQTTLLRDNLGIALLCMAKPIGNSTCETNNAVMPNPPWWDYKQNCEFDWDAATRGRILGSFLYGYILTTVLGGFMSNHYGAKLPMMLGGIGNTAFHLLLPTAVLIHTELYFVGRFLQGMSSGLMVGPCFHLFAAWATEDESSKLVSFGFSGFSFGTILSYPMSGLLCGVNVLGYGGWPLIYYAPAFISILILIYWYRNLYNSRAEHPYISQEENNYLLENIGLLYEADVIPWVSIFTSMPIVAYMMCYFAYLYNVITMMNNIPMFMQTMLSIKPAENGYIFCIAFIVVFFSRIFNGRTYPMVKNSLGISNTACRKLYCTFGFLMAILSNLSIILMQDVTKLHMIIALIVNLALGDFAYSGGFFPTLLDLAPNYAGLLSGVSTFFAFLFSCPSTLVNSIIVKENTKEEWNTVLWIIVVMFTFTTVFYLIFGSASLQPWSAHIPQDSPDISRSTVLLTQSYTASRNVSLKHPLF